MVGLWGVDADEAVLISFDFNSSFVLQILFSSFLCEVDHHKSLRALRNSLKKKDVGVASLVEDDEIE